MLSSETAPMSEQGSKSARLDAACASFRSRCYSMGLAPGTITWYEPILRDLTRFLAGQGVEAPEQVLPGHLRDFLSSLRQRGLCSGSIFRYWGAIKCFFRFLNREGTIPANPMSLVERPKRERRIIPPLNMAQVCDLLAQPDRSTTFGLRDLAMMLLMVDSGLRVEETLTLELRRTYLAEGLVTVAGKGGKDRSVPISKTTRLALENYLT